MTGYQLNPKPAARTCLSIVSLLTLALAAGACSDQFEPDERELADAEDNQESPARPVDPSSDEHFVDADEAAELALLIGLTKTIDEVQPVPDEFGDEVFHVINYREGGFIILAADDRVTPVLAFSETGRFDLDGEVFPEGLVGWLGEQRDHVQEVRVRGADLPGTAIEPCHMIELVHGEHASTIQAPGQEQGLCPGGGCQDQFTSVAPLLSTTWGQTDGYNDGIGAMGCDTDDGRPPVGCVVTATAQVMRYHQQPAFNWAAMPDDEGTSATANLMVQVGWAVGVDWECDGSEASTSDVPAALKNNFGYSSASYASFSWNTVRNELNASKPVILRGGRQAGWWIFSYYTDGHAWVTDGYRNYYYCDTGSTYTYLHMNWGWSGAYNGYFMLNNWNPADKTFNYQRGMVYNIRP